MQPIPYGRHLPKLLAVLAGMGLGVTPPAGAQPVPFPPGQIVTGPIGNVSGPALQAITTGAQANTYTGSLQGGFIPTDPAAVIKTTVPSQFVRFFNANNVATLGPAVGPWIATSSDVRGLTAAQVKNILALPDTPTSVAIVTVPAGTCILGAQGNPALGNFPANPPAVPTAGPWGAAGAPQYYIVGQNAGPGCATPTNIVDSNYIAMLTMGTYALAYAPNAGGGNTGAVANALDHALFPAPFTPMDSVYNSLDLLNFTSPAQLRAALSHLSGEINADLVTVSIDSGRRFLGAIHRRVQMPTSAPGLRATTAVPVTEDGKGQLWFAASGATGSIDGDGLASSHAFNMTSALAVGGYDYRATPQLVLGFAAGFAPSAYSTSGLYSNGSASGYHAGLYGRYAGGPLYVDATVGFGLTSFAVNRQIAFPGQFGMTQSQTNSRAVLSALEVGRRMAPADGTTVTPFAALQSVSLWQDGFSEYGAGPLNLDVTSRSMTSLRSVVGAEATQDLPLGDLHVLQARLRLGWAHDWSGVDRTIMASFQQLPGAAFQVTGAQPSWNAAVVGAELATRGPIQLLVRYDGEYSQAQRGHAASIGIVARF